MTLFVEGVIRARAKAEVRASGFTKQASDIIAESAESSPARRTYDIFLSHSFRDAELVLGMKATLEDLGHSVYVDWITDPALDRNNVTAATADKLRERMGASRSLFYLTTANSTTSKWMPWECGYFDGKSEKVAIVPVLVQSSSNAFLGQEYLSLYPYVVSEDASSGEHLLWVHKSRTVYCTYRHWMSVRNSQVRWTTSHLR